MTLIGNETETHSVVKNKNSGTVYKKVMDLYDPSGKTYVETEHGSSAFEVKTDNLIVEALHPSLDHSVELEDQEWEAAAPVVTKQDIVNDDPFLVLAQTQSFLVGSALMAIRSGDLDAAIGSLRRESARLGQD